MVSSRSFAVSYAHVLSSSQPLLSLKQGRLSMALPNPFAGETDRRLGKTESRGLSRKKARPLREAVSKQALGGAFREEKESDWIHN